jgi:hypothetical protein
VLRPHRSLASLRAVVSFFVWPRGRGQGDPVGAGGWAFLFVSVDVDLGCMSLTDSVIRLGFRLCQCARSGKILSDAARDYQGFALYW